MNNTKTKKSDKINEMQHQNNSYDFDVWAAEVKRQLIAVINKRRAR